MMWQESLRALVAEQLEWRGAAALRKVRARQAEEQEKRQGPVGHEQRRRYRRSLERFTRRTEPKTPAKLAGPGMAAGLSRKDRRYVLAKEGFIDPSARELFADLQTRRLASRPVLEVTPDGVLYGEPTFRNVIDENGRHV